MMDRFMRFSLAILEISRFYRRIAAEEMAAYGLRGASAAYLTVLLQHEEGLTGPQLCQLCGRDKSDVSRMLSAMEEQALVRKEEVNHSLYRGRFRLTERGREVAEQVCRRTEQAMELAGGALTEEVREHFYQALDLLVSNLKILDKEGLPQS